MFLSVVGVREGGSARTQHTLPPLKTPPPPQKKQKTKNKTNKVRLAPMCPWIGSLSLAFVGPPSVKVQLSPYNRVRLMRVPILQVG